MALLVALVLSQVVPHLCATKLNLKRGGNLPIKVFTEMDKMPDMWTYNGSWQQIPLTSQPVNLGQKGQQHSQAGQDWLVSAVLGCNRSGYFVELAANDALVISNTLMLERDFGWNGLCIEANPRYFEGFRARNATLIGAAVGSPTNSDVTFQMNQALGGIVGENMDNEQVTAPHKAVHYKTIAFGDLLDRFKAPAVIDYLSLDVEGAESLVMQDFPWQKYTFRFMTIERPKPDLVAALQQHGYEQIRILGEWGETAWIHTSSFGAEAANLKQTWANGAPHVTTCMEQMGYPWPTTMAS